MNLALVFQHLPEVEQRIFAAAVSSEELPQGHLEAQSRQQLLAAIDAEFKASGICQSSEAMYVFADELRAHLAERGIDTDELFQLPHAVDGPTYPLHDIVFLLALSAKEK